jgi:hypothetical protein
MWMKVKEGRLNFMYLQHFSYAFPVLYYEEATKMWVASTTNHID